MLKMIMLNDLGPEIWSRAKINGKKTDSDVSSFGRIRIHKSKKLRKKHSNHYGYLMVNVKVSGKYKLVAVHRLVAEAFIPNPEGKPEVNHKNGRKYDNTKDNLEWVTHQENTQHAYDTGLNVAKKEFESCHNKYSEDEIKKCIKLFIKGYNVAMVIKLVNIKYDTVCHIYHGLKYRKLSKKLGFIPVPWKQQFDFSPYEDQVKSMIVKGLTPKEIRTKLPLKGLSEMQYNYHIRRIKTLLKGSTTIPSGSRLKRVEMEDNSSS